MDDDRRQRRQLRKRQYLPVANRLGELFQQQPWAPLSLRERGGGEGTGSSGQSSLGQTSYSYQEHANWASASGWAAATGSETASSSGWSNSYYNASGNYPIPYSASGSGSTGTGSTGGNSPFSFGGGDHSATAAAGSQSPKRQRLLVLQFHRQLHARVRRLLAGHQRQRLVRGQRLHVVRLLRQRDLFLQYWQPTPLPLRGRGRGSREVAPCAADSRNRAAAAAAMTIRPTPRSVPAAGRRPAGSRPAPTTIAIKAPRAAAPSISPPPLGAGQGLRASPSAARPPRAGGQSSAGQQSASFTLDSSGNWQQTERDRQQRQPHLAIFQPVGQLFARRQRRHAVGQFQPIGLRGRHVELHHRRQPRGQRPMDPQRQRQRYARDLQQRFLLRQRQRHGTASSVGILPASSGGWVSSGTQSESESASASVGPHHLLLPRLRWLLAGHQRRRDAPRATA